MKTSVLPTLPPTSAADVAAETGDVVVTVSSPKAFRFTDDQYRVHEYAQGVYDMPAHHANHWFVKAHGVKPYIKPKVGKADAE